MVPGTLSDDESKKSKRAIWATYSTPSPTHCHATASCSGRAARAANRTAMVSTMSSAMLGSENVVIVHTRSSEATRD